MFSFTVPTQLVLHHAGWTLTRHVDATPWITLVQHEGYSIFPTAITILEHLGGLRIRRPKHSAYLQLREYSTDYARSIVLLPDATPIIFAGYPSFDFLPDEAPHAEIGEDFRSHPLLAAHNLVLCPIGAIGPYQTMFVTSDGRIFAGDYYAPSGYENMATLTLVGETISDAVNRLVEDEIGYV